MPKKIVLIAVAAGAAIAGGCYLVKRLRAAQAGVEAPGNVLSSFLGMTGSPDRAARSDYWQADSVYPLASKSATDASTAVLNVTPADAAGWKSA
jgi:hypothetical protein